VQNLMDMRRRVAFVAIVAFALMILAMPLLAQQASPVSPDASAVNEQPKNSITHQTA